LAAIEDFSFEVWLLVVPKTSGISTELREYGCTAIAALYEVRTEKGDFTKEAPVLKRSARKHRSK
jgi:hypothetical protein